MADAYESVLCVKNEVFVYKIPPRPSNRGYKASDWKLDAPDWTGRLRVVAVNKDLFIKLEDKISGELFAQCPVDEYPGVAVEQVMDSSRYFVLRIKDPSGRSAFIGVGFADRSDSFDLNVSIQDHFKWLKQEQEAQKATKDLSAGPKLDLGFKEGQTITLNIGSKSGVARTKPKPRAAGEIGLLPPPPGSSGGGIKLPPPSGGGGAGIIPPPSGASSGFVSAPSPSKPAPASNSAKSASSDLDFLLDLGPGDMGAPPSLAPAQPAAQNQAQGSTDFWGDFASAGSTSSTPASANNNNNNNNSGGPWVQF